MRNISRYIERILIILSGFLDNSISRPFATKLPKSLVLNLREGWEIFFRPQYLPKLWTLGAEIFCTLEIKETHFLSEFQDPNPKNGAWGDNRRNKKICIF